MIRSVTSALISSIYLLQCFLIIQETSADLRARANNINSTVVLETDVRVDYKTMNVCEKTATKCSFEFEISKKMTMYDDVSGTRLYAKDGKLVDLNGDVFTGDASKVMTTDGYMKLLTVANGQFPGPSVEVWSGQTVEIKVINAIATEVVTIHWHGLHQRETPWMDGVGRLTQCSIVPGDSFTYTFIASPSGTMWYHSHVGAQRVDGLYGNFIIRDNDNDPALEHTLMINNYNHQNNGDEQWKLTNGIAYPDLTTGSFAGYGMGGVSGNGAGGNGAAPDGFKQGGGSQASDGSGYSPMTYHSTLINGKGRFFEVPVGPNATEGSYNGAPLSVFPVDQGKTYRFRLINGGSLYPYQFSIESHTLTVVASDGAELQPVEVESVIVSPGERYDVTVRLDESIANYWIRAMSMVADGSMPGEHRDGLAILHYVGAPTDADPTTEPEDDRLHCTEMSPCKVAACPFPKFAPSFNSVCLNLGTDLKRRFVSSDGPPAPKYPENGDNFKQYFLNFHLVSGASVNGRRFGLLPPFNVLGIDTEQDEFLRTCSAQDDPNCGDDKVCRCPLSIFPQPNEVMELVIMNIGDGAKQNHPIHIHGHYWHVLKVGQLEFDDEGKPIDPRAGNPDMKCNGGNTANGFPYCNNVEYSNSNWKGDNIPGLDLENAPLKDTINIPQGGYFITRIVADNPGLWFMHCHIEVHVESGMAMVIAEPQELKNLDYPPELQKCGITSTIIDVTPKFCDFFTNKNDCKKKSSKNCKWNSGKCKAVDCSKYNKKKDNCKQAVISCKYDSNKSKCKPV